jgi:hypothetical protein
MYGRAAFEEVREVECTASIKERWLSRLDNLSRIDNSRSLPSILGGESTPSCEAFPGRRSVLVMDNASIHKDVRIKTACQEAGVLLQFLPPYSPDYNPIESMFKDLKAWVKKNYLLAAEFCDFAAFLEFTVQQQARKEVRGHFRCC